MLALVDWPEPCGKIPSLFIGGKPYRLLSARPHKNIYILRMEGVADRNAAEALVGLPVEAAAGDLPARPAGKHYDFEILGLAAVCEDGSEAGIIREIIHTGANDVYVIRNDAGEEILLPAIPDCVLAVDLAARRMTVRLQEWED